jgi:deoxyribodipyrimidine photolyase-related protein
MTGQLRPDPRQCKPDRPRGRRQAYRPVMTAEASLVFPHHLFPESPALQPGRTVALVEDPLVFGDPELGFDFHAKKLLYHLATMRAFEERLRADGYQVVRVPWAAGLRTDELLARALPGLRVAHLCEPDDFLLEKRLRRWAAQQGVELILHPSPLFLTPRDWADCFLGSKKRVIMADFYTAQRRRLGILVDEDGQPAGGRWSFDEENRKRLPVGHRVPQDPIATDLPSWMPEEIRRTREQFPRAFGNPEGMPWPVTPAGALRWLDDFLDQRLGQFGDYEDAIHTRERVLFHGQLTPMMNAGLLPPALVVERALAAAADRRVPLNALEGFLRQIIGWREFMRVQFTSRSDEPNLAVGFNPRITSPRQNIRRGATVDLATRRQMIAWLGISIRARFKRRAATHGRMGLRIRGLKPTATFTGSLRDRTPGRWDKIPS